MLWIIRTHYRRTWAYQKISPAKHFIIFINAGLVFLRKLFPHREIIISSTFRIRFRLGWPTKFTPKETVCFTSHPVGCWKQRGSTEYIGFALCWWMQQKRIRTLSWVVHVVYNSQFTSCIIRIMYCLQIGHKTEFQFSSSPRNRSTFRFSSLGTSKWAYHTALQNC